MVTCIPSFLTLSGIGAFDDEVKEILKRCDAIRNGDWGRELYYLRKYRASLFERAGEELRETHELHTFRPDDAQYNQKYDSLMWARYGCLPTFADWQPGQYQSEAYSDAGFEEWFRCVTEPAFVYTGLALLAEAWIGAHSIVEGAFECKISLDELKELFERFGHPLFDRATSEESVRARLGMQ